MLPDYPALKSEIMEFLNIFLRRRTEYYAAFVSQIPKCRIFEGTQTEMHRSSGRKEVNPMIAAKTLLKIRADEVPTLSIPDILTKLDGVAKEMAEQIEKGFFLSLAKTLERAGRKFGQKGQRLTGKTLLESLRHVSVPFDDKGQPDWPTLLIGTAMRDAAETARKEIAEDPELKREFEALMVQKREEWRADEASRKLVG